MNIYQTVDQSVNVWKAEIRVVFVVVPAGGDSAPKTRKTMTSPSCQITCSNENVTFELVFFFLNNQIKLVHVAIIKPELINTHFAFNIKTVKPLPDHCLY